MAVPLRDGFFAAALLAGVVLCALGVYSHRRFDEPGTAPFAAMAVVLGLGAISGTLIAVVRGVNIDGANIPAWSDFTLLAWTVAMVPWFLFALQYTGRLIELRWQTVAAVSAPVASINLLIGLRVAGFVGTTLLTRLLGTVLLLYIFALVAVGSYLVLRTSYEYGHLSVFQGASLTLASTGPLVLINSIGTLAGETSETVVVGVYAAALVTPAAGLLLAVFRYRMFDSTPATGALGERAIPRETDDLVFVVDREDRVITLNEAAAEAVADAPTDPLGESFSSLTDRSVEALAEAETVELETSVGRRKFDPAVTAFTDQHDRRLGSLLSLRDVTDRELRKQRLEVLNRVLRHNLRNRVDVIKSNTEAIAAESDDEHVEAIRNSADELATLGSTARETDRLVSRRPREERGDLSATVRKLVPEDDGTVTVSLALPEEASLVTDWVALRQALGTAIENAITHGETAVAVTVEELPDGYAISVADDGPGIPESELASLDAETETPLQHSTGLDLWQLEWGITKLGGELSFDTSDGTTVRMRVPDQSGDDDDDGRR
jgi:signal transduction histidine kinase